MAAMTGTQSARVTRGEANRNFKFGRTELSYLARPLSLALVMVNKSFFAAASELSVKNSQVIDLESGSGGLG